jgi:hypothetical protein
LIVGKGVSESPSPSLITREVELVKVDEESTLLVALSEAMADDECKRGVVERLDATPSGGKRTWTGKKTI